MFQRLGSGANHRVARNLLNGEALPVPVACDSIRLSWPVQGNSQRNLILLLPDVIKVITVTGERCRGRWLLASSLDICRSTVSLWLSLWSLRGTDRFDWGRSGLVVK
jgi:hypothetical protein